MSPGFDHQPPPVHTEQPDAQMSGSSHVSFPTDPTTYPSVWDMGPGDSQESDDTPLDFSQVLLSSTGTSMPSQSQNHTIFTNPPSGSQSQTYTSSNVDGMSQSVGSVPSTTSILTRQVLEKDPMELAMAELEERLNAPPKIKRRWRNWEKNRIVRFFFGRTARVPVESPLPMSAYRSPKSVAKLEPEWSIVRRHCLH